MQAEYLDRLSAPLQQFILDVETHGRVHIWVEPDSSLNDGGPFGQGYLAVELDRQPIRIFAPTNGYFPEGAVRHEVLHVWRFHVEDVPQLVAADNQHRDRKLVAMLGDIDNALEHMVIVPEELRLHPERRPHWEAVMAAVWGSLQEEPVTLTARPASNAWMHWAFLRHALPDSPVVTAARRYLEERGQFEDAHSFADRLINALSSKEEMVHIFFDAFDDVEKHRAALRYLNGQPKSPNKP